ncbi:hypothetical protein Tco_1239176 [Tanacetum coccineum]
MAAGVVVGDTTAQVDLKLNKVESKPTGSNKGRIKGNSMDKILMLAVVDNVHEMIGNSMDKILMLAVVDNVSSVDNIDNLHIHGSVLLIYCAYAFFTDVRILSRQLHLDCGCSHAVCVSFNFVENGRMAERKNWSPQQPP